MNGGGRLLFFSIGDLFRWERVEGAGIADDRDAGINLGSPGFAPPAPATAAPESRVLFAVNLHGKACQLWE
jgi:hypothetical protein